MLKQVQVHNFKALAQTTLRLESINVFFGPNGAGKSSLLDALWFLRDCATRGVDEAASDRNHGIGLLWDDEESRHFSIHLETEQFRYAAGFQLQNGRIAPSASEKLEDLTESRTLINRYAGSDHARIFHPARGVQTEIKIREQTKLTLGRYLDLDESSPAALAMDSILRNLRYDDSRDFDLRSLKSRGSEGSFHTRLSQRGANLWSVLRNLKDRREIDPRYDTIESLMKRAFPKKFRGLIVEQVGSNVVAGSFLEAGRRQPVQASNASDGYLQLLVLLTALFSEGPETPSIVMFDEPDHSLHPHALAVFGEAIVQATDSWRKQVLLATHSPVLLSQFEPEQIYLVDSDDEGKATFQRVTELQIGDLLETYAVGSLYMAEAVGAQSSQ